MSAQGNLTGGVAKKSGVQLEEPAIAAGWTEVRDDINKTCFVLLSYASKVCIPSPLSLSCDGNPTSDRNHDP